MTDITPCLWFDGNAEEAARFWCGLLPDSRITQIARAPIDNPSTPEGAVLTVEFELMGRPYLGLNGGPRFSFTEAVSLMVPCATQAEIDQLVERAGFRKVAQRIDEWGIFTVCLAQRVAA